MYMWTKLNSRQWTTHEYYFITKKICLYFTALRQKHNTQQWNFTKRKGMGVIFIPSNLPSTQYGKQSSCMYSTVM